MTLSVSLLSASTLLASALVPAQADPAVPPPAVSTPAETDAKDPDVATAMSTMGTVVPLGLVLVGAGMDGGARDTLVVTGLTAGLLGPSIGHWYAGEYWTPGLGLRLTGSLLATFGLASGIAEGLFEHRSGATVPLLVIGTAVSLSGAVYDIATAGSAAREYNREHGLSVAPAVIPSGEAQTYGLSLAGSF